MRKKIILILAVGLFFAGCRQESVDNSAPQKETGQVHGQTEPDRQGSLVEFPVIAKMSPDEIEKKLLAAPGNKLISKNDSSQNYTINNGAGELSIRFNEDKKIARMELEVTDLRESSDDILRAAGFDLKDEKPDWENAIVKDWNNRIFNGVRFKEISAGMSPPKKKWDSVDATLE
jgi:hypothetical protein